MSCSYVIDSYAWIEYFKASKLGEIAKEYIESEHSVTPTIVISELSRKLTKDIAAGNETAEGRQSRLGFIKAATKIAQLDFETAAKAGEICEKLKDQAKGWGLADSIVFCIAANLHGKVVTGDDHFRHMQNVIFIKE